MRSSCQAEQIRRLANLRDAVVAGDVDDHAELEAGLGTITSLRSWLAATESVLVGALATAAAFPEASIAGAGRCSLRDAAATTERAETLGQATSFSEALTRGTITTGHVDELTRAGKRLDDNQRDELFDRSESLLTAATDDTVEQFRRRLSREVNAIQRDDGEARLARQQRASRLSSWVDNDGMWNLRASFDPLTGARLHRRLDRALDALFAETTPATCPTDPVEKQKHLKALALAHLIEQDPDRRRGARATGASEIVAVIDIDRDNGHGEPTVDWGLPIELPVRVLREMADARSHRCQDGNVSVVAVRNGIVIHAPGELDLGRAARHATRDQRRALRGLYRTCAIPGCTTHFDRCKVHHVEWWSRGGTTDFQNLLPVCVHHHHKIHDADWQ
ncbi:HNH endonuclease signature motif containing protein, partial [Ilumatobacter nonamiensis]|uniref:HNH endonuclease signature motif containing protein n=1 Tax=Ilumatobacter nonamiensis TaxID=467093 RepID=UPI0011D270B9